MEYSIQPMTEDHLVSFCIIRNACREYLHNDSWFSLRDVKEWFKTTNNIYYAILDEEDNMVGYFRTSFYSSDYMYVGADIHPDYQNQGIASLLYPRFLDYIFNDVGIGAVLEVLETNERAIHLYEKLGFEHSPIPNVYPCVRSDGSKVKSLYMFMDRK